MQMCLEEQISDLVLWTLKINKRKDNGWKKYNLLYVQLEKLKV